MKPSGGGLGIGKGKGDSGDDVESNAEVGGGLGKKSDWYIWSGNTGSTIGNNNGEVSFLLK